MNPSQNNNNIRFTLAEKRGIFILIILILIFFAIRLSVSFFSSPDLNTDHSVFEQQVAVYEKGILEEEERRRETYFNLLNPNRSFEANKLAPFEFDPNTITKEGLISLGLTEKQASTIENYKAKGGKFKKKEDFKKMYCISDAEYEILAPFLIINQPNESNYTTYEKPSPSIFIVELNVADTLDLQELKGIGSVFSNRIINYRNKLGGFYDKKQLLEVKGITEDLLSKIDKHILIDTSKLHKLDINKASLNEIKKHPYLDYYQAKAIIKYREEIKSFDNINELLNVNLIYEENLNKIKPYLSLHSD